MFIRSSICTVLLLTYLASSSHMISCDAHSDIQSDPSSASLLSMLKKFEGARNDKTRPEGKQEARDFINSTLKEFGLHVWTERAKIGESTYAENIVGMLRSSRTGTADDKIVIVGAHYDTTENTTGVDDNGSGVTALLQVAKNVAGETRGEMKNTVLFVAFDFEEWSDSCSLKWRFDCGSNRFVKNLTSYLSRTGGTVSGAIILETMLNHDSSAGSQTLPLGFNQAVPDASAEIKNDSMRGNFLAVVGRKESDRRLLSLIRKHYPKDSGDYRAQIITTPISGRPSLSPLYKFYYDLYRSDHYMFWEANASYSALMLTDTANFRGYMRHCYHMECDNLSHVEEDDLEFLRRSINTVIKTVLDLSEAGSCGMSVTFSFFLIVSTVLGTFLL